MGRRRSPDGWSGVGRGSEQEHEQRVRDFAVRECRHDGGHGEASRSKQSGGRTQPALHGEIDKCDGADGLGDLGQEQRPIVEAEGADAERLDPERPGELVQGNGGTVHGAPHERGPGLRHGVDGRAVIIVHKPELDTQGVHGAGRSEDKR